uniref:Uncharacterized protein n=1 Tax=Alexandrium monilatum TaxID=311494 RepID=A0A7S4STD2_9DINO
MVQAILAQAIWAQAIWAQCVQAGAALSVVQLSPRPGAMVPLREKGDLKKEAEEAEGGAAEEHHGLEEHGRPAEVRQCALTFFRQLRLVGYQSKNGGEEFLEVSGVGVAIFRVGDQTLMCERTASLH